METKCLNKDETIKNGGQVIENSDGTVTVFVINPYSNNYYPKQLNLECCKALNPNYFFDIDNQECRWSSPKTCGFSEPINLVINTKGNDGSLFFIDEDINETCTLDIKFDYLLKIKCEDLMAINTPVNTLSQETIYEINTITTINEEIATQIENINNQIILLNSQLIDTPFSIECDTTPILITELTGITKTVDKTNFNKTGFGVKTADLLPEYDEKIVKSYTKFIYCLTDYGLQAWELFLGPIRFQAFINGDSTSYNCKDVDKFINTKYQEQVVFTCKIPFGTRTKILIKIKNLGEELTLLQTQLLANQTQINILQTQLDEETSSCSTIIESFESLDISMTLEVLNDDNSLTTVFESPLLSGIGVGNLYTYLTNNSDSGFYICGGESCNPMSLISSTDNEASCNTVLDELLKTLYSQSGLNNYQTFLDSLPEKPFISSWLTFTTAITDSTIIEIIKNRKIKINIKINSACGNFCILLDNINLNQNCSHVDRNDILITKNPGFDFKRVVDNKKSWVDETLSRKFLIESVKETNVIRQTNYNINDERLVLNSKEIDLDINIAKAIETDIWKYILDNPCLLTGETLCNPCFISKSFQDDEIFLFQDNNQYIFMDEYYTGNTNFCCGDNLIEFDNLITSDISNLTTISDFTAVISSELIDVKNRQTISGYATLRALYDRYINSVDYCNNSSSGFDYYSIEQFAGLIGDYWIDIIEQVIPSTTIWGSVKIYTNTIFDDQKFKYKSYTSLLCNNNFIGVNVLSPINGTSGKCENVEVISTNVLDVNSENIPRQIQTKCDSICISQMNYGSEFIGVIKTNDSEIITEPDPVNCLMSEWTPWTDCISGGQSRTRYPIILPQNGGKECEHRYEERNC
jgi:hypothetical protein